jgi:hypothetical protein
MERGVPRNEAPRRCAFEQRIVPGLGCGPGSALRTPDVPPPLSRPSLPRVPVAFAFRLCRARRLSRSLSRAGIGAGGLAFEVLVTPGGRSPRVDLLPI